MRGHAIVKGVVRRKLFEDICIVVLNIHVKIVVVPSKATRPMVVLLGIFLCELFIGKSEGHKQGQQLEDMMAEDRVRS